MWTLVDDNDVLQVRASIATAEELDKVISALERKREKFKPVEKEKADERAS